MSDNQKLSKQEVEKTADLIKIKLSEQAVEDMGENLGSSLDYFRILNELEEDQLGRVDLHRIQKADDYLRKDEVKQSSEEEREAIKANFSDSDGGKLRVKTVL